MYWYLFINLNNNVNYFKGVFLGNLNYEIYYFNIFN